MADSTWAIDTAHSNVEFRVKHMMISNVNGAFKTVRGTVTWDGNDFASAQVNAEVDTDSVTTYNDMRDDHLRTNDFFNAEMWPHITFESTKIEPQKDDEFELHGNLTIRDISKPVVLETEYEGLMEKDAGGKRRAAFSAETEINRKDFGVNWNNAIESGGVVVGDKVKIRLNIAIIQDA